MENPEALAVEAGRLAAAMEVDPVQRLDVAYQLLTGRVRIAELDRELAGERRRLEACIKSMGSGHASGGSLHRAVVRVVPALLFFVAGMVAFAVLTLVLSLVRARGF